MNQKIVGLLKRLSFVVCKDCAKHKECDTKMSSPIKCEKMSLINQVLEEMKR